MGRVAAGGWRRTRAQSILYAVLLMPTLFLVMALAVDITSLQLERLRLAYAVDLATVTGADAVDTAAYGTTGRLRLDPVAASALTRDYLARNLRNAADLPDPVGVAASAEIAVVNDVPSRDPYRGNLLDRPTVCARVHVLHHFAFLGWIGLRTTEISVAADSEIRA